MRMVVEGPISDFIESLDFVGPNLPPLRREKGLLAGLTQAYGLCAELGPGGGGGGLFQAFF